MSLMAKAMGVKVGNSLRKLVLIKLADNANDKGECWPSYQHIADQCECSRTAVRNHIDALEENVKWAAGDEDAGRLQYQTIKGVKTNTAARSAGRRSTGKRAEGKTKTGTASSGRKRRT